MPKKLPLQQKTDEGVKDKDKSKAPFNPKSDDAKAGTDAKGTQPGLTKSGTKTGSRSGKKTRPQLSAHEQHQRKKQRATLYSRLAFIGVMVGVYVIMANRPNERAQMNEDMLELKSETKQLQIEVAGFESRNRLLEVQNRMYLGQKIRIYQHMDELTGKLVGTGMMSPAQAAALIEGEGAVAMMQRFELIASNAGEGEDFVMPTVDSEWLAKRGVEVAGAGGNASGGGESASSGVGSGSVRIDAPGGGISSSINKIASQTQASAALSLAEGMSMEDAVMTMEFAGDPNASMEDEILGAEMANKSRLEMTGKIMQMFGQFLPEDVGSGEDITDAIIRQERERKEGRGKDPVANGAIARADGSDPASGGSTSGETLFNGSDQDVAAKPIIDFFIVPVTSGGQRVELKIPDRVIDEDRRAYLAEFVQNAPISGASSRGAIIDGKLIKVGEPVDPNGDIYLAEVSATRIAFVDTGKKIHFRKR